MTKHVPALILALVACGAVRSQAPEPLTTEAALALFKGKSISTQNTRWGAVSLNFRDSGALSGSNSGGTDNGRWKVEDGKLCLEWRKWDYEGCGVVRKVGTQVEHLWPDGRVHFSFTP